MDLPIKVNKTVLIAVGGGVVVFTGGALSGYFYAEHKLRAEVASKLEEELDGIREHYSKKYKSGQYATPETAVEATLRQDAGQIAQSMGYLPTPEETTEEEPEPEETVVKNVFIEPPADRTTRELEYEGWDYENERARRAGKKIYIITQEEFFTNEPEHNQATLTYFEGDGVLVDETDVPIDDISKVVGTEHNLKFGHGTSDPNSVHIRNEELEHDVEVVRSHGKFGEEVMGFLQHSDDGHRKPPKGRWDDE